MSPKETLQERNARYAALPPAEKRMAVAQDVINQLDAEAYIASSGSFVQLALVDYDTMDAEERAWGKGVEQELSELSSQEAAHHPEFKCQVCGVGGVFLSTLRLFNQREFDSLDVGFDTIADYVEGLHVFPETEMQRIEIAFERGSGYFQTRCRDSDLPEDEVDDAVRFGECYSNPDARLRAIMGNILDNNGYFLP